MRIFFHYSSSPQDYLHRFVAEDTELSSDVNEYSLVIKTITDETGKLTHTDYCSIAKVSEFIDNLEKEVSDLLKAGNNRQFSLH